MKRLLRDLLYCNRCMKTQRYSRASLEDEFECEACNMSDFQIAAEVLRKRNEDERYKLTADESAVIARIVKNAKRYHVKISPFIESVMGLSR